jgi:hypothetical protein
MLKVLKNQRAQIIAGEYVVIIFIVVAMMTAMGTYVKRALQGRIRDARKYMVQTVWDRTVTDEGRLYNGPLWRGYEPYYVDTNSAVRREDFTRSMLLPGGASQKEYKGGMTVFTNSETAPPRDAD